MNSAEAPQTPTRLESWKEIAAYLQRDATTARRWEREEGLPVHRHSHNSRSSVYAYSGEIDAWRLSRKTVPEPVATPVRAFWRVPTFALAILSCLVMVGNGIRPQAASAKSGPLAKRLVCADCKGGSEADFSRDGRWMVLPHEDHNDLSIRDLVTGQVKRLMVTSGKDDGSGGVPDAPVFSPDRRWILYGWYEKDRSQLRLMGREPGSKPRVLAEIPEKTYYTPADWFPDGKSALVLVEKDATSQLVRMSMSDATVIVIKQLEWRLRGREPQPPRLSPDGQYIVYSALAVNPSKWPPAPSDPKDRYLYVLAADGSRETAIVKTAGFNDNAVWTQDSKHILFISDRSGKNDLWSIAIQNGKAAGPESLVSLDIGDVRSVGVAGGSYYYSSYRQVASIHIAKISPSGSTPEPESIIGIRPAWSPDGKSLAFKRHRPGSADRYDLVIHSLETGEERTPLAGIGTTGDGAPLWSHDGGSIITGVQRNITGAASSIGPAGLYRIDLKSGDLKELLPNGNCGFYTFSPDEKTLYLGCNTDGHAPYRVVARDLSTGQERLLATLPAPQNRSMSLSPDGRALVARWLDGSPAKLHMAVVQVDGSGSREVYTTANGSSPQAIAWDRDGRSILFDQRQPGAGAGWGVMRVPAEGGGPATLVFATPSPIQHFDVSPDGSRIAYSVNERASELWALDNVLPMLK